MHVSLHQNYLPDDLAHILNHHLVCSNRLHGKQAPLVDVTPAETNPLPSELTDDITRVWTVAQMRQCCAKLSSHPRYFILCFVNLKANE